MGCEGGWRNVTHPTRLGAVIALLIFLVTGCDQAAPGRSPSAQPSVPPTAMSPSQGTSPTDIAPTASPAASMAWGEPESDRVTAYTVQLSVSTNAAHLRRIVFSVTSNGRTRPACTSAKPGEDGAWSCRTDLLRLGVPPGKIAFSARAYDTDEHVVGAVKASWSGTYAVAPPRPEETAMKTSMVSQQWTTFEVERITWTSPKGYATEFRLYGVSGCPNERPGHDGEPCLVEHTHLDASMMKLLKKVDGAARTMTVRGEVPADCDGPGYFCSDVQSLVLGAYNAYGHSVYAIVASTQVCLDCYR
jgi:hypothetical protein